MKAMQIPVLKMFMLPQGRIFGLVPIASVLRQDALQPLTLAESARGGSPTAFLISY